MTDFSAAGPTDEVDELEDLEPEPADAENIKGGAAQDADPTDHGGSGGSSK